MAIEKREDGSVIFCNGLVHVYPELVLEKRWPHLAYEKEWVAIALGTISDGFKTREDALAWALNEAVEMLTSIPNWDQQP